MRIVLLAGHRSLYAERVARAIAEAGVELSAVVIVRRRWRDAFRMLRSAGRSAGWPRAVALGIRRLRAERRASHLPVPPGVPVLTSRGTNSPSTIRLLGGLRADVIALAQPGIVGAGVLAAASHGVVNVHPGWLPHYRGIDVGKWAVLGGDIERVGVSAHWVDRGVDTGPVIRIRALGRPFPEDPEALDDRLDDLAAGFLAETLALLARGETLAARPQERSEGRYYRKMDRRREAIVALLLRSTPPPPVRPTEEVPCES